MRKFIKLLWIILSAIFLLSGLSYADIYKAYLDPVYTNLVHPQNDSRYNKNSVTRNNVEEMLALQTSVKSQGRRGSCSIFSTTAFLEALLIFAKIEDISVDLSEEWMAYLTRRTKTSEGSTSYDNLDSIKKYGDVDETDWPFIGETWKSINDNVLAMNRCGKLTNTILISCLLSHRNPRLLIAKDKTLMNEQSELYDVEFYKIRTSAVKFKKKVWKRYLSKIKKLYTTSEIKTSLNNGIPVILDLLFFYGAWNHVGGASLGININLQNFAKGIVSYPEPGSVDYVVSKKAENSMAHSILLIGYDDNVIVKTNSKMMDGSYKVFTYKGVYYFKNSWGTNRFGTKFTIGTQEYPGYGMITQKYAEEHGGFITMRLKK